MGLDELLIGFLHNDDSNVMGFASSFSNRDDDDEYIDNREEDDAYDE